MTNAAGPSAPRFTLKPDDKRSIEVFSALEDLARLFRAFKAPTLLAMERLMCISSWEDVVCVRPCRSIYVLIKDPGRDSPKATNSESHLQCRQRTASEGIHRFELLS